MDNPQGIPPIPEERTGSRKRSNRLLWPIILIVIGVFLFAQNLGIGVHFNWWAVFIFIPVVASLTTAWNQVQKSGRFDSIAASSLGGALVVGTVAVLFLFGMNWAKWWPLMIITPGVSILLNGLALPSTEGNPNLKALLGWNLWLGLAVILLGFGFLVQFLPIPMFEAYLAGYRWWAVPILIAGGGALISALLVLIRAEEGTKWAGLALTAAGLVTLAVGVLALLMLSWNLLLPIILIAVGVVVLTGVLSRK